MFYFTWNFLIININFNYVNKYKRVIKIKAEIITVGTEILLGDILNTNTHYLANELANMGIDVYYQITVGDNESRLYKQLDESFKRSDLIILTGGLGPRNT